jgi:hypothetical protein
MALTLQVTKKSVQTSQRGLWIITLNLQGLDGTTEVINRDFSIRYKTGQDMEVKVKGIQEEMQELIANYKSEQVIFNHAKLTAAINYLNSNLVGG